MATPIVVQLTLDSDADFVLRGIYVISQFPFSFFHWNYSGPSGYFYAQDLVSSCAYSNNASQPTPVLPEVLYPAGSVIRINWNNDMNVGGTRVYTVVFVGVKRFHTGCEMEYDKLFLYPVSATFTSGGIPT